MVTSAKPASPSKPASQTRLPLRGEVHLVRLDPTWGSEIRKTRPCLIGVPEVGRLDRSASRAGSSTAGHVWWARAVAGIAVVEV